MSQRDGFASGFFLGAIFGSVIGGVVGAVVTSRRNNNIDDEIQSLLSPGTGGKFNTEESIEIARRRLEDKITQLNLAIDDARQQLGNVNGNPVE